MKGVELHFSQPEQFASADDCVVIVSPMPEAQQGLFVFIPVLI